MGLNNEPEREGNRDFLREKTNFYAMKHGYMFIILCSISFSSALKAQVEGDLVILADEMYSFGDKRGAQEVYL